MLSDIAVAQQRRSLRDTAVDAVGIPLEALFTTPLTWSERCHARAFSSIRPK
jgi:hypothetical protein